MTTQVHPLQSTDKPDLRIIPLDQLIEHEYNDVQRTQPLAERLKVEGVLKNPPIVAPLGDGDSRFVVLDGANRTTALGLLHIPTTLAQVVEYGPPTVTLTTWHHVVTGLPPESFSADLHTVLGLDFRETHLLDARAGLARRDVLAYTILADGRAFVARTDLPRRDIHERNRLLNAMVDTYKDKGRLFRATADNVDEARRLYPDLTGLVIFPNYETSEVLALAREGELLPTGLTRHLIQGRVLRTNYPLSELSSTDSFDAQNARLQEWLKRKMSSKEMRFYGESTYLFDE
jgi:hypothetical protein